MYYNYDWDLCVFEEQLQGIFTLINMFCLQKYFKQLKHLHISLI